MIYSHLTMAPEVVIVMYCALPPPGPGNPFGLHLQSHRGENGGLEAEITLDEKYQAFPGILNGGALTTLVDCHGNWSAAIYLMDQGGLPRPPLTVTSGYSVRFLEPTPPNEPLLVRSVVTRARGENAAGLSTQASSVEVEITVSKRAIDGTETVTVRAQGYYTRIGALRAL